MISKTRTYKWVKFPPDILLEASRKIGNLLAEDVIKADYKIEIDGALWRYDHVREKDFFSDYQSRFRYALFKPVFHNGHLEVVVKWNIPSPSSQISIRMHDRSQIERIFEIFDKAAKGLEPSWKSHVQIFIGHGRNSQWKALMDFLKKEQNLSVEAYEIGARAGFTTKEILEEMLEKSSIAFLVMTGEDQDLEGNLHARENVIHEVGLFQGKLGFRRAIILLEEGCNEFSNIKGIEQIRFKKDSISGKFDEVLSTLNREFG